MAWAWKLVSGTSRSHREDSLLVMPGGMPPVSIDAFHFVIAEQGMYACRPPTGTPSEVSIVGGIPPSFLPSMITSRQQQPPFAPRLARVRSIAIDPSLPPSCMPPALHPLLKNLCAPSHSTPQYSFMLFHQKKSVVHAIRYHHGMLSNHDRLTPGRPRQEFTSLKIGH